ncbi:MAG: penicillin-binding transpeptidase domain-containing protein, partial [Acidobacteriota bacterium]
SATLAAMIQGPNRLDPVEHPERVRTRRNWVLKRMEELGWASADDVARVSRRPVRTRLQKPRPPLGSSFLGWVQEIAREEAGRRLRKGRGVVAETSLDPLLQDLAERAVLAWRADLQKHHLALRERPFEIALVTLDAETGDVLAHVSGGGRGGFDRVRQARRQPGSAVKPLVLLEAFEDCGPRDPLHVASRIADRELRIDLPSGPWEPQNYDRSFRGVVTVREALRDSLNVPFARLGRHCTERAIARRLRRAGLGIPPGGEPPPSMVLGAVETSPVALASAYTAIAAGGERRRPRPVTRLEKPGGRALEKVKVSRRGVTSPATAFLVHDLLRDAVRSGTASGTSLEKLPVAAKTGSSSDLRDAWLAGYASGLVTVVWVGRDDGAPLGLTGAQAAAPLWRRYMERASAARPPREVRRPQGVVTRHVDRRTGLRVLALHPRAEPEIFRRGAVPPRDRLLSKDAPAPILE